MKKLLFLATLLCGAAIAQIVPNAPANLTVDNPAPTPPPSGSGNSSRIIGDEWFVQDMAAAPSYGFSSNGLEYDQSARGNEITVTRSNTGGPLNRPFVRQSITNTSLYEFGAAWRVSPGTRVSWGGRMFVRFSFRLMDHYNQTQKLMMFATGDPNNDGRSIIIVQPWGDGYVWRIAIDGGLSCQTDGGRWNGSQWQGGNGFHTDLGQWSNIQVEIRFSSGPGVPDGSYKIWRNNNNYNSPDCASTNHVVYAGTPANTWLSWSGYHQGNVAGRLPRTFDHADLRIGPSFDSSWHR